MTKGRETMKVGEVINKIKLIDALREQAGNMIREEKIDNAEFEEFAEKVDDMLFEYRDFLFSIEVKR